MSRLEPGAVYVYEKTNGITYARKMGDLPDQRFEIGRDHNITDQDLIFGMSAKEVAKMVDAMKMAKHHPALQDALDRVKVIYELSKQENTTQHHPV